MHAVSDEQLIQWVANGDASCLGTLFERHHRAVYQYCRQMTRNDALSEDLVQDVFLKVLKKAGQFRGEGSFKAWLFNVARNVTFDALRKDQRRNTQTGSEQTDDEHQIDSRSAEQAAAGNQTMQFVVQALALLPPAVREVIWLGRFEFQDYAALGQALGCTRDTARVRMHRAMKQLNAAYVRINGAPIDV